MVTVSDVVLKVPTPTRKLVMVLGEASLANVHVVELDIAQFDALEGLS